MTSPHTVLLIDGMSFLFRAFYATSWNGNLRQTSSGVYTNAVYGFTKMMLDYTDLIRPSHVAVAWDIASRETLLRTEWYDRYKSNRVEPPSELIPQFDLVKEVTSAFEVPNVGHPGFEGDDILGTLGKRFASEGHRVIIATGDYDCLQLVEDRLHVKILKNGGKHEHFCPTSLFEQRQITPEQVIDIKALQGDASDCIPGCPGVGEKTAHKWIREFGSLDGLYENLHQLTPKMQEKLIANRELVYLSKKLATIMCDAPVELSLDEAKWEYDKKRVQSVCEELEFGRPLLSRVI